jgi:hypothetical protein
MAGIAALGPQKKSAKKSCRQDSSRLCGMAARNRAGQLSLASPARLGNPPDQGFVGSALRC